MVEINVNELADLRISQYKAGSPIGQLISAILSDFQAREVDQLLELADWPNSGVMLDWLGELLGLPRPLLNVNATPGVRLQGDVVRRSVDSTILLSSRSRARLQCRMLSTSSVSGPSTSQLRGTASLENMLNVFGERGTPTFIQATDELDGTVTVRFLDDTDKLVWDRMWDIGVAPIPAGISASSVKVSSF